MVGIHQVLTAAVPGDAVTNTALELRRLLRRVGPSEIYARHIAVEMQGDICNLRDHPSRHTGNVLIHHASIGEPYVHAFLASRSEPLVLVYHNVTPSSYFERWDPLFAELLDLGRRELYEIRDRVAVAIAASQFNARELEAIGYRDVKVVPPVIDPWRLRSIEPAPGTLNHLDNVIARPFVLSVGQILPHKRPEFLVDAMHYAGAYLGSPAMLMMVGHRRLPAFADALSAKVRELNLPTVHLVGPVPPAELAAMYTRASAMVVASDHEGFCVPPIEAMTFDVPVIARGCAAVPETIADAGLLLPPEAGPALFGEAIDELLGRPDLRAALVARGRARVAELDVEATTATLLHSLLEVV
jgi:glycosyltransferase involved in cell wall biosynthesis